MRLLKRTEIKRLYENFGLTNPKTTEILFILSGLENRANIGSMFRLAEALGAKMYLCGKTITPPHPDLELVSKGQETRVDWHYFPQASQAIKTAKQAGYSTYAIELTDRAVNYATVDYPQKIAFVLGNENTGVHDELLSLCDLSVFIPMYGKNYSLNVAISAAIVAYHALL